MLSAVALAASGTYFYLTINAADREVRSEVAQIVSLGTKNSEAALRRAVDDRATAAKTDILYALARTGGEIIPYYWLAGNIGGPHGLRRNDWPQIQRENADGSVDFSASRIMPDDTVVAFDAHGRYVVFDGPMSESGERSQYHLMIGRNRQTARLLGQSLVLGLTSFAFASIATGLLTGFRLSRFVYRRTRDIRQTADGIMGGDLSQRIGIESRGRAGPDEFDKLSLSLNSMLDQIQKLLQGMREVSDNIAHDLRTPLNRLKSRLELALVDIDHKRGGREASRAAIELALGEAEGLLATFNALMRIARLEAGAALDEVGPVEAAPILHDVVELYEPVAEEEGLTLSADAEPGLMIRANRELVSQALVNLVENAIKFSPAGTAVTVSAMSGTGPFGEGRGVNLTVADDGPGIAPEDRARVLKRFVRLDRGRGAPGSGLGLSLVNAIAQLHHAELVLDNGTDGKGLVVSLIFPVAK